jgi:ATP synthase protein I
MTDSPKNNDQKNPYQTDRREILRAYGLFSAIGIDIAACLIAGTLLGRWLDTLWGTKPWMLLVGIVLGAVGGVYGVVKLLQAFNKPKK